MVSWDAPKLLAKGVPYTPSEEQHLRTKQLMALLFAKNKTLFTGNHGGGDFNGNLVKYYLYMLILYITCNMADSPVDLRVFPWNNKGYQYYQTAKQILLKVFEIAADRNEEKLSGAALMKICENEAKNRNISLLAGENGA